MSELLPCPFCGGEAKSYNYWKKHIIECDDCKEYGHGAYVVAKTEAEAIEAWNTRADDYKQAAEYWQRMYEEEFSKRTCHVEHMPKNKELRMAPWIECSECGGELPVLITVNYCPKCGAKVINE